MGNKIIDKITSAGSSKSATGGVIREYPFGSGLKGLFVLTSTGSGIVATDTLQVTVSEYDYRSGTVQSNETPTQINWGAGNPLLQHLIITGSQLNSLGQGPMPIYDIRDYVENYSSATAGTITQFSGSYPTANTPRIMSTVLHIKWNLTGSGTWNFGYQLLVEQ